MHPVQNEGIREQKRRETKQRIRDEAGTISEEDLGLMRYVETAEEAIAAIDAFDLG